MSETKLKCCPFCGGEARVRDCTREEQYTIVDGQMYKMCGCEHYCVEMFGYTEEEAIKKWNTRKPMDNIVAELDKAESVKTFGSLNSGNRLIPVKDAINIVKKGGIPAAEQEEGE